MKPLINNVEDNGFSDNLSIVSEARNAQVMFVEKPEMKINSF